jgi:sirohydrochlorin ferrochelatase
MSSPLTLLVDNGSLEPAATLALRGLAAKLSHRLGHPVAPVSLLHSSGIDPKFLEGRPAEILFPALERRLAAGHNDFVLLPLFFGPSQALTVYVPESVARLRAKHPALHVRLAPPLHAANDDRLARLLADNVRVELDALSRHPPSPVLGRDKGPLPQVVRVALVDHGSPVTAVTAVRNELATQLAGLLGAEVAAVAPCSMERQPEPAYDFTAPLLADLLVTPPWSTGRVIVAMQFLLPGRHAGLAGDVAEICRQAGAAHPGLRTRMTGLVGAQPLLVEILADRWKSAIH